MTTKRMAKLVFVAVFALALSAASSAFAASTNNLSFNVNGSPLEEGKSESVTGSAVGAQTLKSSGLTIVCKALAFENGKIIGSKEPNPGTGSGSIKYSECEVTNTTKNKKCQINGGAIGKGVITTEALTTTQVYLSETGAINEEIAAAGTVFKPASGTLFAKFTLKPETGGECPIEGTVEVKGAEAATSGVVVEDLEAAANKSETTHKINAPTTAIKNYYLNEGGSPKKHEAAIKVAGLAATYSGEANVTASNPYNLRNK